MIRFYRRRGGSAECYRAVCWPDDGADRLAVIEEVRQLLGKQRPGAAMIVRFQTSAIIDQAGGTTHVSSRRDSVSIGSWIVIPQDSCKPITVLSDSDFQRDYVDATIKGASGKEAKYHGA